MRAGPEKEGIMDTKKTIVFALAGLLTLGAVGGIAAADEDCDHGHEAYRVGRYERRARFPGERWWRRHRRPEVYVGRPGVPQAYYGVKGEGGRYVVRYAPAPSYGYNWR
jgi:hypothetical protein